MSEMIELGGRRFEVRPLKLGQLRHLLDALEEMTGTSGGGLIEAAAKVVAAGLSLVLNACTATKLSLPTKTDDYEIQEFDFSAFADPSGTIGALSVNE